MANLKDINYGVGKYLELSDASGIPDIGTNRKNVDLLNFKIATNNAYTLYNFKDGMIDAYQTEDGVDATTSTNETYDSSGKYYSGSLAVPAGQDNFTTVESTTWTAPAGVSTVTYLVVGGGGAGGRAETNNYAAGGGGAGGLRTGTHSVTGGNSYTVTVGSGAPDSTTPADRDGDNSVFDTITAAGGGGGGSHYAPTSSPGRAGGSGGGATADPYDSGGAGNTPSTSPSQGNPGGGYPGYYGGGGGGGAGGSGPGAPHYTGGPGGVGLDLSATFGSVGGASGVFAGGGGGGSGGSGAGPGGSGGGGPGNGGAGTANTGGGGGGRNLNNASAGGAGGSGFVAVKWDASTLYQNMTLISNIQTARAAPTEGRLMIYEEASTGTITLDTDIKGWVSRDGGTTYTQTLLVEDTVYQEDENVKLLMHMDGVNDGTTFTDSSLNQLPVTRDGTPVTKTAEKVFGTASCLLAGTDQWLKLPESDNWSFDAGQDFTVECWVKFVTQGSYQGIIASKTSIGSNYNGWSIRTDSSGGDAPLSFNFWNDSPSVTFTCNGTSNIGDGSWHHVAATRASDTVRVFVDGTQENSGTYSGAIHGTSSGGYGLQIGMDYLQNTGSGPIHAYVDEVRIVRGVAKYTASFTEPTSAFNLEPQRILSGSVDISGQPSGTNMKYKIETLNQSASKVCRLHGASLLWA